MHYGTLVIIDVTDIDPDEPQEIDSKVEDVLEPFRDKDFDWYQIGGRWTGALSGYDPSEDSELKGKWPTDYPRHAGDIVPVESLTEDHLKNFAMIVVDGHGLFKGEVYMPWKSPAFVEVEMPPLAWIKDNCPSTPDKYGRKFLAVVVDCHN